MSQVQIPNSDHFIWRAWINHLCKSGLDPIDCKSSFQFKTDHIIAALCDYYPLPFSLIFSVFICSTPCHFPVILRLVTTLWSRAANIERRETWPSYQPHIPGDQQMQFLAQILFRSQRRSVHRLLYPGTMHVMHQSGSHAFFGLNIKPEIWELHRDTFYQNLIPYILQESRFFDFNTMLTNAVHK